MLERILLFDEHHPDEPLEVEVEELNQTELIVTVANTHVRFKLLRPAPQLPFEGSLGGRAFAFCPVEPCLAPISSGQAT